MITPAKQDLMIFQGSTFKKLFRWSVKNNNLTVPVDLTGYTMRMQIREKVKSETFIVELTTENGGIVIDDPEDGSFYILIGADETSELEFKSAVYDLEVIDTLSQVSRLLEGNVSLSLEVTRPVV